VGEDALASGVAEVLGALDIGAGDLHLTPITGGASRQTFRIEGAESPLVLRRDPPGAEASFSAIDLEVRVIETAAAAGAPVVDVLRFEPTGGRFETAGFLMRGLDGTSVGTRILRREELANARQGLPAQLAAGLARVHSVDPAMIESLPGVGDADPALAACDFWQEALDDWGHPQPVLEAGLRWLRANLPSPPARRALVHGDFRLGNFIASERGLEAVIDWELCHAGDPAEDIAWLCVRAWRFGNDDLPVAGLALREPFLAAYEAAGGVAPDEQRLLWWEAMGNLKWAVICSRQAADHLTSVRRSHELASLGRRICEPEWDLLELIS
jgi:aminoglycoside phosphotransferase (APT) family kinase protein